MHSGGKETSSCGMGVGGKLKDLLFLDNFILLKQGNGGSDGSCLRSHSEWMTGLPFERRLAWPQSPTPSTLTYSLLMELEREMSSSRKSAGLSLGWLLGVPRCGISCGWTSITAWRDSCLWLEKAVCTLLPSDIKPAKTMATAAVKLVPEGPQTTYLSQMDGFLLPSFT